MNPTQRKMVAIVGRPNVGKSALFNRLAGMNISIVHDLAGVTRDRLTAECRRGPEVFDIMDTGGIGANTDDILTAQVQIEAEVALEVADLLLFVVDVVAGTHPIDLELAKILRKTSKPVVLVCNKADSPKRKMGGAEFTKLGFKDTVDVSAAHGLGIPELMDVLVDRLGLDKDAEPRKAVQTKERALKLAIVGRPNAGKSSLLNAILGDQRAIVSEIAGTTRDSVDVIHQRGKNFYTLIDTAGIRRQAKLHDDVEVFSVKRAIQCIERADICLLVVDCAEGIKMQDRKIAQLILESRKPCILVMNKWDLYHPSAPQKDRIEELTENVKSEFFFLHYAPIVALSAKEAQGLDRLFKSIETVKKGAQTRLGTGVLNRILHGAIDNNPGPLGSAGKHSFKLLYATQVNHTEEEAVPVPHFVLFANRAFKLQDSYLRFLESKIRDEFPGEGLPFVLKVKGKAKR